MAKEEVVVADSGLERGVCWGLEAWAKVPCMLNQCRAYTTLLSSSLHNDLSTDTHRWNTQLKQWGGEEAYNVVHHVLASFYSHMHVCEHSLMPIHSSM